MGVTHTIRVRWSLEAEGSYPLHASVYDCEGVLVDTVSGTVDTGVLYRVSTAGRKRLGRIDLTVHVPRGPAVVRHVARLGAVFGAQLDAVQHDDLLHVIVQRY